MKHRKFISVNHILYRIDIYNHFMVTFLSSLHPDYSIHHFLFVPNCILTENCIYVLNKRIHFLYEEEEPSYQYYLGLMDNLDVEIKDHNKLNYYLIYYLLKDLKDLPAWLENIKLMAYLKR